MTDDKLATVQAAPIAPAPQNNLLAAIARAAADPTVDPAKMRELLQLHRDITADAARVSFKAALAELQAVVPQINKSGRIVVKGNLRSKYAKLEDIDVVVRPLCAQYGFSLSYNSQVMPDGKNHRFTCELSHRDGHSETREVTLPIDKSDYRSDVQSFGSSETYAKRRLLKMHLNIVERDEDDDGNGGRGPVSAEQAKRLRELMVEAKANEARFLNWAAAASVEEIPAGNFDRCVRFLEEKKRTVTP